MSKDSRPVRPSAIAGFENWPAYVLDRPRFQAATPAAQELSDALGVPSIVPPADVTVRCEETHGGVTTSRLSWQLGFGPPTTGWLVRPAGSSGPLPGVLALHCHGGNKFGGADRLVDLPESHPSAAAARTGHYGGRALATDVARRGFAVLAHDTFSWGSRRFDLSTPPWRTEAALEARKSQWREAGIEPSDADLYNAAAGIHEDTAAKAAGLLGTSLAGMAAHDDLAALDILAGLPGVDAERLGCIGFSGGGGRALALAVLSPRIRNYVITCMMTTFQSLLPAYLDAHSWLLQTPGLWAVGDWPELTGRSAAQGFLVQYALADELFPEEGMRQAHQILESLHGRESYTGSFWPGGHVFTAAMQNEAISYLSTTLRAARTTLHPLPTT
ncbi:dienelactone hydrolase [Pseudarthrobacter oxydans]|uniref:acetylxylan esterase n=1 Tax=Pseudarthrobacter oxydans TaxID=1671 RepID=UPI0027856C5A|nr:acetylxylan esterase [Pseudarthrobacter oxydans]MDP9982454.1 dienelactone hydrolase [Pseudarthrobacter oxydans]